MRLRLQHGNVPGNGLEMFLEMAWKYAWKWPRNGLEIFLEMAWKCAWKLPGNVPVNCLEM
jgi:hypothetical protein